MSAETQETVTSASKFIETEISGAKLISIKVDKPQGLGDAAYLAVISLTNGGEEILELFKGDNGEFRIIGRNAGVSGLIANIENDDIKGSLSKFAAKLDVLLTKENIRNSARSIKVTLNLHKIQMDEEMFEAGEGHPSRFNPKSGNSPSRRTLFGRSE